MANPQMPQKNSTPGGQNRKSDVPPKFSEDTHKAHQATEVSNPKADAEPGLDKRATEADPSLRPLQNPEVNQAKGSSQWNEHVDDFDSSVPLNQNENSNDRRGNNSTH